MTFERDEPAPCPGLTCPAKCGAGCVCQPCTCRACGQRSYLSRRGAFTHCGGCNREGYTGGAGWVGRYCSDCAPAALEAGLDLRARPRQLAALLARAGGDASREYSPEPDQLTITAAAS